MVYFDERVKENNNMKSDILIAYYSWHGKTKKIAGLIADATGGELFELEPVQTYSSNYQTVVDQAKKEIAKGFYPELKALPEKILQPIVFMGSPIWWYTMAPPVATFLSSLDLTGKTIVPFHTHGGGGGGRFEADISGMCSGATIKKGLGFYNDGGTDAGKAIERWLASIGLQD